MQEYADEIVAELRNILDQHKGFILYSQVVSLLSESLRSKLYLKRNAKVDILKKKIGYVVEENFKILNSGKGTYLVTPCDPEDLVMDQLSENKSVTLKKLVIILRMFKKAEVLALVTEMVNAGKVRVKFEENEDVKLFACGAAREAVSERRQIHAENNAQEVQAVSPEEYTQAKFRAAYDELHRFREFVRICDLRRSLNWPRDVFDGMIRTLRDNRTIQIFRADESHMTQDDVRDCFVDENHTIQGIMIWNGR